MTSVMIIDGANVVGSHPDGWWKDRAAAARRLHDRLSSSDLGFDRTELALEGKAKQGVPEAANGPLVVIHAVGLGDEDIVRRACSVVAAGEELTVVTADRDLGDRIHAIGASTRSPNALLAEIGYGF